MAVLETVLVHVANIAMRADQATSTASSSTTATTTSPQTSQPSGTDDSSHKDKHDGGSNNPLLFFVALGFGVVFTNLWIIVGVKYCFRYNARNRARMMGENGEPVALENMPRPHRRRREKKLMTIDEVNDKFPMMKYKTWVSERAREGLPTAGGVSVPASRASSLRDAAGVVPDLASKERASIEEAPVSGSVSAQNASSPDPAVDSAREPRVSNTGTQTPPAGVDEAHRPDIARVTSASDDDDDEQINAALPPELLAAPGDTCAICIDTLEDDEDVRGLTCGHAFHAVCVDPWLTSRRACCPLCKADYYVPKPRPNPDGDGTGNNASSLNPRQNARMNLPGGLSAAWYRGFAGSTFRRQHRPAAANAEATEPPATTPANPQVEPRPEVSTTSNNSGMLSSMRDALSFGRRRHAPDASANPQNGEAAAGGGPNEVTPSQLESGSHQPTAATTNS